MYLYALAKPVQQEADKALEDLIIQDAAGYTLS